MARRRFLKTASTAAAALSALPFTTLGAPGANNRISVGLIGVGGRGTDLMRQLLDLADNHNVRITAVCDVWAKNLARAADTIKQRTGTDPAQFTRFGELLEADGLDAVIIATPDFAHAPILVAALESNKDVYIEKPMSIDLSLASHALDLARQKHRVVQVGTQYRSDSRYRGAARCVADGSLGTISRLTVSVNFNEARWARNVSDCNEADVDWDAYLLDLPKRPFDARLLRRWQLYRMCTNGLSGLWMSHYTDLVHMLTGAQYPDSAVALGGNYVWHDGREHTDTFHALLSYPDGFLFDWAMSLGNSAGNRFAIHGTKGTADLLNWTVSNLGSTENEIHADAIQVEPEVSHMENWLECIRSRQKPRADIQYGHQHVVATVMAANALFSGQRQHYNAARRVIVAA